MCCVSFSGGSAAPLALAFRCEFCLGQQTGACCLVQHPFLADAEVREAEGWKVELVF